MGRAALPSIAKLEDVLDLIIDPAKYIKYMTEFKSIYADAKSALGDLDTKEKADFYLAQSLDAKDEAALVTRKAKDELLKAHVEADEIRIEIGKVQNEFLRDKESYTERFTSLVKREENFAKFVEDQQKLLESERKSLTSQQEQVAKLQLDVQAKREKLEAALR
jgi:hypothetical protein